EPCSAPASAERPPAGCPAAPDSVAVQAAGRSPGWVSPDSVSAVLGEYPRTTMPLSKSQADVSLLFPRHVPLRRLPREGLSSCFYVPCFQMRPAAVVQPCQETHQAASPRPGSGCRCRRPHRCLLRPGSIAVLRAELLRSLAERGCVPGLLVFGDSRPVERLGSGIGFGKLLHNFAETPLSLVPLLAAKGDVRQSQHQLPQKVIGWQEAFELV